MHNIFGASYGEMFHSMYHDAGLRTFLKARAMYVGSQAHPTTFYSDNYEYPNYLLGVINSGWGGWVWSPETRHATGNSDFARRAQLMLPEPAEQHGPPVRTAGPRVGLCSWTSENNPDFRILILG